MTSKCVSCNINLKEATLIIFNKKELVNLLIQHGLIEKEIPCGRCDGVAKLNINSFVYRCGKMINQLKKKPKQCTFNVSARNETWFAKSKLSIEDIMYFTVLWCRTKYPRQEFIKEELRCSSKTIVDWSSYCREVCVYWAVNYSKKIGGPGVVVEVDEAKFGKRKYNRGRKIEGQWVFGGFERNSKNIFLVPVAARNSNTLIELIKEWILPGTIIISDFWKAYEVLDKEDFIHLKINHSLQFVDPNDPSVHTQNIERTWRDVRGGIPRYGRVKKHFIGYLAEFLFKRANKNNVFHSFLIAIANLYHRS